MEETLTPTVWCYIGVPGALDGECGPDPGQQRPELTTTEDSRRPDPDFLHPAGFPLHLREQAHGHHRPGASERVLNRTLGYWWWWCWIWWYRCEWGARFIMHACRIKSGTKKSRHGLWLHITFNINVKITRYCFVEIEIVGGGHRGDHVLHERGRCCHGQHCAVQRLAWGRGKSEVL